MRLFITIVFCYLFLSLPVYSMNIQQNIVNEIKLDTQNITENTISQYSTNIDADEKQNIANSKQTDFPKKNKLTKFQKLVYMVKTHQLIEINF